MQTISSILFGAFFVLSLPIAGCSKSEPDIGLEAEFSLQDILKDPSFKATYAKLHAQKQARESDFGKSGMAFENSLVKPKINDAQEFYEICSPSSSYQSDFLKKDWQSKLLQYDTLTSKDKTEAKAFVMGVATDSFYCGSMVQLSFPLEDAIDQAREDNSAPCLENYEGIYRSDRYKILFFDPVDRDPTLIKRHSTVKDVIADRLEDGVLCTL